jgi:hypothetical protein
MQRKLAPVDLAIVDKYAQYNQEFLSLVGLKNSMAAEKSSRSPSTWLRTSGEDLRSLIFFVHAETCMMDVELDRESSCTATITITPKGTTGRTTHRRKFSVMKSSAESARSAIKLRLNGKSKKVIW